MGRLLVALFVVIACATTASAAIYKYRDAAGAVTFVDHELMPQEMQARGLTLYGTEDSSPPPAAQPVPPPAGQAAVNLGTIKVDRTSVSDNRENGIAQVTYTNTTGAGINGQVAITCEAFDKNGKQIGSSQAHFLAEESGVIAPGYTNSLEIPVELNGATFETMNCRFGDAK